MFDNPLMALIVISIQENFEETDASYHLERVLFFQSAVQADKSLPGKAADRMKAFGSDTLENPKECNSKIHGSGGIIALVLVKEMSCLNWCIASGGDDGKIKVCAHATIHY